MKAKSLSVFRTKRCDAPGTELVTIGQIIEGDDDHLRALARNGLVQIVDDMEALEAHIPASVATSAVQEVTPDDEPDTPPAAAEQTESTETDAKPESEPEPAEATEPAKGKKAK